MELKPCPFCGGQAAFIEDTRTIKCKNCGGAFICTNPLISMLEVAEAWNRRTVQWISVKDEMPVERQSAIPGLGTVSKTVLVTWVDPTSNKPYPENRFVRESMTRNGEFTIRHINGDIVPVAWLPYPEPSKEEYDEN